MYLLLALAMQGCVPAAFVVGAAAGGAVVYDNRDMQTIMQDRNLTFQAQQKIDQAPEFKDKANVSIATFNHIVLLVGQVPTEELRKKAEDIVKACGNSKVIHNEIVIDQPISKAIRTNDAWITTKVKARLMAERGLNSTQIKIVTEDGVVYMMGIVTHSQGDIATEKTKETEGVSKVVKLFEYIS